MPLGHVRSSGSLDTIRTMQQRPSRVLSRLAETFWILVLAIVVLFAFFLALGAFTPGDVVGLTIVVGLLAVLWVAHAVWDSRHRDPHDRAIIRASERRGF
jgi:O-antigen/teichoic acid export membrane protein